MKMANEKHYYIITPSSEYEVHDGQQFWIKLRRLSQGRKIYTHDYGNVVYYELDEFHPIGMIDRGIAPTRKDI